MFATVEKISNLLCSLAALATAGHKKPPDPMELLRQNRDATYALKSYQAQIVETMYFSSSPNEKHQDIGKFTAKKPNLGSLKSWEVASPQKLLASPPSGLSAGTMTWDGRRTLDVESTGATLSDSKPRFEAMALWQGFYSKKDSVYGEVFRLRKQGVSVQVSYEGQGSVNGVKCDIVTLDEDLKGRGINHEWHYKLTVYSGLKDHLFHRCTVAGLSFGERYTIWDYTLQRLVLNGAVDPNLFKIVPPQTLRLSTSNRAQLIGLTNEREKFRTA